MPVFNNILAGAAGSGGAAAYEIERSLRFNSDDATHLSKTLSSGNQTKFTISVWVKRSAFDNHDHIFQSGSSYFRFQNSGELIYYWNGSDSVYTTAKFRDAGAWYHVVMVVDTAQATTADRVKMWVNGVQQATTGTWMGINSTVSINAAAVHYIGSETASTSVSTLDGYMADLHFLDGIAISDPDGVFGEFDGTTGVWNPIEYDGNYNGAAVAGTSYSSATGAKSLYNTTNDGQTLGSGYATGAINSATKLIIPGFNLTEGGGTSNSGQSISNSGATTVTSGTKYYGAALQFGTSANQGNSASNCITYSQGLGLSGADFFTIEAWVYPRAGQTHGYHIVFEGDWNNNNGLMFGLTGQRKPELHLGDGSFQSFYSTQTVPADQWSHVAVVNLNNTISFYVNGSKDTASGTRSKNYSVGNHHKLIGAYRDSNYIGAPRNPFYGYMTDIRVTADSKYTSAFTVPGGGAIPAGANGFHLDFSDNTTNATLGTDSSGNNNTWTVNNLVGPTVGPTITSVKAYSVYNGASVSCNYTVDYSDDGSSWTTAFSGVMNNNSACGIFSGTNPGNGSYGAHKYWRYVVGSVITSHHPRVSRIMLSDGTTDYEIASWTSDNCSDNGTIPGTNSVYSYTFSESSTDSLIDSPTNYEAASGNNGGNYATWNPLHKSGNVTLSQGNLHANNTSSNLWITQHPTIGSKTGKYYSEFTFTGNDISHVGFGVGPAKESLDGYAGAITGSYTWFLQSGFYTAGGYTDTGSAWTTGLGFSDLYGIAVDLDNSTVSFYKNGSLVGTKSMVNRLQDEVYHIYVTIYGGITAYANFGARPFAYTPPSGYKSLCTQNLPTPDITDGSNYFEAKKYDGTGSTQSITGLEFSPSFVWIKPTNVSDHHILYDTVRGVRNQLYTTLTNTEEVETQGLSAFTSDGFTVGGVHTQRGQTNNSNSTYISWNWDAGSTTDTNNTNGTITPTGVRANQTAGFSIVTWSVGNAANNSTIGHGLGAAPSMIICKTRNASNQNWIVYHKELGTGDYLALESTQGSDTRFSTIWGTSAPTSTVFGVGETGYSNNSSNNNYVAYCFAPVEGYSAFGKYTGNGSPNGTFVYTGFKPRWLMIKRTSSTSDWYIIDTARDTYNVSGKSLQANTSNDEPTIGGSYSTTMDVLSNGFKLRDGGTGSNYSSNNYIYAAFAELPLNYSRAR